jgi:hypothetical protein
MLRTLAAPLALLLWVGTQDRADLRLPIDTWYKVVQGSRTIGYAHEVLKRADPPWRYEYGLDVEYELTVRGKVREEELAATAFLDDALAPVEFSSESHSGESSAAVSVATTGDDRRVEVKSGAAEPVAWTSPAQEDLLLLPALALYPLRQSESLSRPGRLTRRALDPKGVEKDGLRVEMEVGAALRRRYLDKDVSVIPITFLRPFPATAPETELREATVDRYGRILEATLAGGAKMVIVADRAQALEGIGVVHRHGRRDPFDRLAALRNSSLERARAARGESLPPKPVLSPDSLDAELTAALKMIEDARGHRLAGDLEEARRSYLQALVHLKAIRELADRRRPDLLPAIERARDDAETAWDGAARVEAEARELYVGIAGLADRLDVGGLERTRKELDLLRDRLEVERRPERGRIEGWALETATVLVKCRTRLDLARARLDVSGITIGETTSEEMLDLPLGHVEKVMVVRPFAMADVNGRLLRKGDMVEGTGIRVDDISTHGVRFSLREEVRDVGLRH